MTLDERQARIDNLITQLANDNTYITREQIARAKSLYRNDYRPFDEIERELIEYSESIRQSGKEREAGEALAEQRREVTAEPNYKKVPEKNIEEKEVPKFEMATEAPQPEVSLPDPVDEMESDLSELFDPAQPQPVDMEGRLGQVVVADTASAMPDPTDELDAMFESTTGQETDFTTVDSLGEMENPKVLTKKFEEESKGPTGGNGEGGFTSSNALLTISIFFSIMGIIVSLLVLYTS